MKKCNHMPKGGKPNRYVTTHYLMCANCNKKLRKLSGTDKEAVEYYNNLQPMIHSEMVRQLAKDTIERIRKFAKV